MAKFKDDHHGQDDTKMNLNPSSSTSESSQPQPQQPQLAPPLKRPDLVSRGSNGNITGGLNSFLRGAAMTFSSSTADEGLDDVSSSESEDDEDDDQGQAASSSSNQQHHHHHHRDQEKEIEKTLKTSDELSLKSQNSIDAASAVEIGTAATQDPLGSGSGSLSSGEKANPLEFISLSPMPSITQDQQPDREVANQKENQKERDLLEEGNKDSERDQSIKEQVQKKSQIINDLDSDKAGAKGEKDWDLAKEKAVLEAQKKEKSRVRALGRLIRKTKGTNEHHHPSRGMSMLDEDAALIRALNSQALDSLEEAGDEGMEDGEGLQDEVEHYEAEDEVEGAQEESAARVSTGSSTQVDQDASNPSSSKTFSDLRPTFSRSSSKRSISATNFDARRKSIDPEEKKAKLEALIQEFGESPCLRGQEPEKLLADCPAVLMRTVLIKGSLIVTSHRVAFVAFLPTSKSNTQDSENPSKNSEDPPPATHPDEISPILKKGPATVHRQGWRRKKKGWFELRSDCITHYPSSDKLYHPIGSLRLDGIDEILPVDWKHPTRIYMKIRGRIGSLELKTEEAALEWRRELEAALWTFRNEAEKIRICIPLERILHYDHSSYLHFAIVGHLYVLNEDDKDIPTEEIADSGNSSTLIGFGVTHKSSFILDVLSQAFQEPREWTQNNKDKVLSMTSSPTIEVEGPRSKTQDVAEDAEKPGAEGLAAKFVAEFSLRASPSQLKLVKVDLVRTIPIAGTLGIGLDVIVFWRPRLGSFQDTKLRIPLADITGIESARAFRFHYYGVRVHIRGHPDLCLEFGNRADRDMTLNTISEIITERAGRVERKSNEGDSEQKSGQGNEERDGKGSVGEDDKSSSTIVERSIERDPTKTLLKSNQFTDDELKSSAEHYHFLPKVVNSGNKDTRDIKPMNIVCMTIGSRGDVQPFIALCKGFKKKGHFPTIVSHPEYRKFVESNGIHFRPAGGDPGALMALSVEHKMFSPGFFRESLGQFREWLDELLRECWEQSQGADLIIESPQTFAGVHVAEALGAKFFRAAAMTWTRTSSYPQAFSVPPHDLGASYNLMSYSLFDQVLWRATSGQINRWRKHMLQLQPTDLTKLNPDKVPFMYNFTEHLVPFPNDWGDRVAITGYWELTSESEAWNPPDGLEAFIEKAKKDGKKLCYVGFGSITVDDAESVTAHIYEAVKQADVRAIVAKGWSDRMSKKDKDGNDKDQVKIPEECFVLDAIPHDWLFPKMDIALHHGGAGTTGASLRAGLVTLIKPFFGDQFFWASQVRKVGAGARVASLDVSDLKSALEKARDDRIMKEKAADIGEKIRKENGVENAIRFVYNNLLSAQRTPHPLEPKVPSRSSTTCDSRRGSSMARSQSGHEEDDEGSDGRERTTLTSRSLRLVSSPLSLAKSATVGSGKEKDQSSTSKKSETISRRDASSSSTASKDTPTSSAVSTPGAVSRRDTSSTTIAEESEDQDSDSKPPEKRSSFFGYLPSLGHARVPSLSGALGALIPNVGDGDHEGDEAGKSASSKTEKSSSAEKEKEKEKEGGKDGEEEEKKKPYSRKRAKAEDIRRRELLKERLEKEKREKEKEKEGIFEGAPQNKEAKDSLLLKTSALPALAS